MPILVLGKSMLASQLTTDDNSDDRSNCLPRISRPVKSHEHPTHHRRPVQHHKAFIDGHLEDTGGLLQLSNCPKLLRFNEIANDEFFCTEPAARQGVTFKNTSLTEPLVALRHFGPEVNPDAPAMGAYKNQ
jgi:hypothetical protein